MRKEMSLILLKKSKTRSKFKIMQFVQKKNLKICLPFPSTLKRSLKIQMGHMFDAKRKRAHTFWKAETQICMCQLFKFLQSIQKFSMCPNSPKKYASNLRSNSFP